LKGKLTAFSTYFVNDKYYHLGLNTNDNDSHSAVNANNSQSASKMLRSHYTISVSEQWETFSRFENLLYRKSAVQNFYVLEKFEFQISRHRLSRKETTLSK